MEQSRLVASMGTVNYLAWAIPAIGFLGTVRGLAGGMSMAGSQEAELGKFIKQATDQLGIAFDCTFVALALSLLLMYPAARRPAVGRDPRDRRPGVLPGTFAAPLV